MSIHTIHPTVTIRAEIDCDGAQLTDLETGRPFTPDFATITVTRHPAGVWIDVEVEGDTDTGWTGSARYTHYHGGDDPAPAWIAQAITEAGVDLPAYATQLQAWQPPTTRKEQF